MSARILIVDDEEIVIRSCKRILDGDEFQVESVQDGREALRKVEENPYDVIILDIMMPNIDGLEVLRRVKETHPNVDVIMITGLSQIDTAVQAMKLGAFDYISKPFEPDELKLVVYRALERRRLLQENLNLKSEVSSKYRFENIIGLSPQMQAVYRLIAQCAPTSSTVLITGESGTGKELIARAIHYNSLRKDKPFVAVDCNALSENLLESELFGHVKGAFTSAVVNKKGMFEVAGSGTLFLDEIGNISMSIQAKLLRVLQEREFRAVGDTRVQVANFRLVTATNKDLKAMVAAGSFRDDLYYRINIFPIHAPALRERKSDIPALAYHFLKVFNKELGKNITDISEGALSTLTNYNWPGNVRELENVMHRAAILATDNVIRQAHLVTLIDAAQQAADIAVPRTGDELKRVKKAAREKSVEEIEKQFVLEALKRNEWNVTKSAEETGMQRPNFQALMKKYAIRVRDTEHDAVMSIHRTPRNKRLRPKPRRSLRRSLVFHIFVTGHHGLEVSRAGVSERAEIDVDQDVEDESDIDKHMHGIDDTHAAEELDLRGKAVHVPQQDAGIDLHRKQQHHDDLIDHALQRIELAIDSGRERIWIAAEDAKGVEIRLPKAADEMLLQVQFRMIGANTVRGDVKRQPQAEIGDQHEADEVVHGNGGAERHHVD